MSGFTSLTCEQKENYKLKLKIKSRQRELIYVHRLDIISLQIKTREREKKGDKIDLEKVKKQHKKKVPVMIMKNETTPDTRHLSQQTWSHLQRHQMRKTNRSKTNISPRYVLQLDDSNLWVHETQSESTIHQLDAKRVQK